MSEQHITRILIKNARSTTYYSEEETARVSRLEVQVIQHLSSAGVIPGIVISGEERRYSEEDLILLRRARRLQEDLGVNLEGIEVILRLSARLDALQHELEQLRGQG